MILKHIFTLITTLSSLNQDAVSNYMDGFAELDDWLQDNVESNNPQECFEAIMNTFSSFKPNLFNANLVKTVKILAKLKNVEHKCTEEDLDTIRYIQKSTFAWKENTFTPIFKVVRPYAIRLVHLCDPIHELRFNKTESLFPNEFKQLETVLDDKLIARHRERYFKVQIHLRDDHVLLPYMCCTPEVEELEQVARLDEDSRKDNRKHVRQLVARKYDDNLANLCQFYVSKLSETFEWATSAAYFYPKEDFGFVARQSKHYQLAVFRYKFCQDVVKKRDGHIDSLVKRFVQLKH